FRATPSWRGRAGTVLSNPFPRIRLFFLTQPPPGGHQPAQQAIPHALADVGVVPDLQQGRAQQLEGRLRLVGVRAAGLAGRGLDLLGQFLLLDQHPVAYRSQQVCFGGALLLGAFAAAGLAVCFSSFAFAASTETSIVADATVMPFQPESDKVTFALPMPA